MKPYILAGLLLSLLLGSTTLAQVAKPDRRKAVDASEMRHIEFTGGTLEGYIDLVQEVMRDRERPFNIVVHENARDMKIPSIDITTNLTGALGIIEMLSNDYQQVIVQDDPSGTVTMIKLASTVQMAVEVINGKQLLQNVDKESLLSAIEIGLKMLGNKGGIELKLHEETGLLFVKGTLMETKLVANIVKEMYQSTDAGQNDIRNLMGGSGGLGVGGGAGLPGGDRRSGRRAGTQRPGGGFGVSGGGGAPGSGAGGGFGDSSDRGSPPGGGARGGGRRDVPAAGGRRGDWGPGGGRGASGAGGRGGDGGGPGGGRGGAGGNTSKKEGAGSGR